MNTIETGLFPLMGLAVGGLLYAVERWVLRLKCSARQVQSFISLAMVLTVIASFVKPVHEVYVVEAERVEFVLPADVVPDSPTSGVGASQPERSTASLEEKCRFEGEEGLLLEEQSTASSFDLFASDATTLFGTIYGVGVSVVVLYFVLQLLWLSGLRRRYAMSRAEGYDLYLTDALPPFSFGRSVFLPRQLDEDSARYVLLHELAHVGHRHFLKLCLLQLLVAVSWYNPFIWLLFGEIRLQQELEVDADVLSQGVDREAYQLSLLRICTHQGRWIVLRSGFGLKPLKQRIIFMNKPINPLGARRRIATATLLMLSIVCMVAVLGCQRHEVIHIGDTRHHPMLGCWTMDWISNTGSGEEVHPMAMHYGFYNDSTFLCYSYLRRQGMNMRFSISGEGYIWQGDTLLSADGRPTDYTFPDDHTAVSRWMKDSTQMAGVQGPDITEQWSRIRPNGDIVNVFRAVVHAKPHADRPMDGVWIREEPALKGNWQSYCLVNDTVFMQVCWHPSTVVQGFRYGGSGLCGSLSQFAGMFRQSDADHLEILDQHGAVKEVYRRSPMPAYLLRAFAPAASINDKQFNFLK